MAKRGSLFGVRPPPEKGTLFASEQVGVEQGIKPYADFRLIPRTVLIGDGSKEMIFLGAFV